MRARLTKSADLFIITYNCIDVKSFEDVWKMWLPEIYRNTSSSGEMDLYTINRPIILLSTNIDLRRDSFEQRAMLWHLKTKPITFHQGETLARKLGCVTFVETCPIKGVGLNDLAELVVKGVALSKRDTTDDLCSVQ